MGLRDQSFIIRGEGVSNCFKCALQNIQTNIHDFSWSPSPQTIYKVNLLDIITIIVVSICNASARSKKNWKHGLKLMPPRVENNQYNVIFKVLFTFMDHPGLSCFTYSPALRLSFFSTPPPPMVINDWSIVVYSKIPVIYTCFCIV